jgi:hypothetical protein
VYNFSNIVHQSFATDFVGTVKFVLLLVSILLKPKNSKSIENNAHHEEGSGYYLAIIINEFRKVNKFQNRDFLLSVEESPFSICTVFPIQQLHEPHSS